MREGGREGGRDGGREGGREWEGGEGDRNGGMEGGMEGGILLVMKSSFCLVILTDYRRERQSYVRRAGGDEGGQG